MRAVGAMGELREPGEMGGMGGMREPGAMGN